VFPDSIRGCKSLGVVESLRFGIVGVTLAAGIINIWYTIIIFTAGARRRRQLKCTAKQEAATFGAATPSYVNASSAASDCT
jgi:hypothetical protein